MSEPNIFQRVNDVIHYDHESGHFEWKQWRSNQVNAGDEAGYVNSRGYRVIRVFGKLMPAHRLAFLLMTGELPDKEVDHINGVKSDNRWLNLRAVTRTENNRNSKLRVDSSSGVRGVNFHKATSRWQVYIGKGEYLAGTKDFFEAVCIRKSAENKLQYHPNHGRSA